MTDTATTSPIPPREAFNESGAISVETITSVHQWNEELFSLKMTRPASFRFRSGEFIMIGLPKEDGKPLLRAYSMACPAMKKSSSFSRSSYRTAR